MKFNKIIINTIFLLSTLPLLGMETQSVPIPTVVIAPTIEIKPNAERLTAISEEITDLYAPFKLSCGFSTEEKILIEKLGNLIDTILQDTQAIAEEKNELSEAAIGLLEHFVFVQKVYDTQLELTMLKDSSLPDYNAKQQARISIAYVLCKKLNTYWNELTSSADNKFNETLAQIKKRFCTNFNFYQNQSDVFNSYLKVVECFNRFKYSSNQCLGVSFLNNINSVIILIESKKQELVYKLHAKASRKDIKAFKRQLDGLELLENHLIQIKFEYLQIDNKTGQYSNNKSVLNLFYQYKSLCKDTKFQSILECKTTFKKFKEIVDTYMATNALPQALLQELQETITTLKLDLQKQCYSKPIANILKLLLNGHDNEDQVILTGAISILEGISKIINNDDSAPAEQNVVAKALTEAVQWSPVARQWLQKALPLLGKTKQAGEAQSKPTSAAEAANG